MSAFSKSTTAIVLMLAAQQIGLAQRSLDEILPVRGFCIQAPSPGQVDAWVRFIGEELAPRSVNTLILRVDYGYQYRSRPELGSSAGLATADVKKLVAACRTNHIRLILQTGREECRPLFSRIVGSNSNVTVAAGCRSIDARQEPPDSRCVGGVFGE